MVHTFTSQSIRITKWKHPLSNHFVNSSSHTSLIQNNSVFHSSGLASWGRRGPFYASPPTRPATQTNIHVQNYHKLALTHPHSLVDYVHLQMSTDPLNYMPSTQPERDTNINNNSSTSPSTLFFYTFVSVAPMTTADFVSQPKIHKHSTSQNSSTKYWCLANHEVGSNINTTVPLRSHFCGDALFISNTKYTVSWERTRGQLYVKRFEGCLHWNYYIGY